jgi:hypothetical protein
MKVEDFDLEEKGNGVADAIGDLNGETDALAHVNDAPGVSQHEVEGIVAAIIRVIVAVFNH